MSETKNENVTPLSELNTFIGQIESHRVWVSKHNLDNLFEKYLVQLENFIRTCSENHVFKDEKEETLKKINEKMGKFTPKPAIFHTIITNQLDNLHKLISEKANSEYNEPQTLATYNKLLSELKTAIDENKKINEEIKKSIKNFKSTTGSGAWYLNENDRGFNEKLKKQTDALLKIFTDTVTELTEFKKKNNLGVLFPRQHYESSNRSNNFYASSSQSGSNNSRNMTTSNTSNTIDNTRLLEQYKALKRNVENEIAQGRHGLYSESTIEELQELSKSIQSILKGKNTKFLEQASLNDFNAQFRGILMDQFIYLYTEIDSKRTNPAFSNIEESLNNLSEKVKGYYNDNNGKHDLPVSELKNALNNFKLQYNRQIFKNQFKSLYSEIRSKRDDPKYGNIKNFLNTLKNNMADYYNYTFKNNAVTIDAFYKALDDFKKEYLDKQFQSLYLEIQSKIDDPNYRNIRIYLKDLTDDMSSYFKNNYNNNKVTVDDLYNALDDFKKEYLDIQFQSLYLEIQSTCKNKKYSDIQERLTELKEGLSYYYKNNFNNNKVTVDDLNNELYVFNIAYRENIINQLGLLADKISNKYGATERTDLNELLYRVNYIINEAADDINVTAETLKNSYNNFLAEYNKIRDKMIVTNSNLPQRRLSVSSNDSFSWGSVDSYLEREPIYSDSGSVRSITSGKGKSPSSPRMRQGG